jgi:hypothetical protein
MEMIGSFTLKSSYIPGLLDKKLDEFQNRSGPYGEKKISLLLGMEPRFLGLTARFKVIIHASPCLFNL